MIPMNCDRDIHICGRCKLQYTDLSLFLQHKNNCNIRTEEYVIQQEKLNHLMNICNSSNSDSLHHVPIQIKDEKMVVGPISNPDEFSALQNKDIHNSSYKLGPEVLSNSENLTLLGKEDINLKPPDHSSYQNILIHDYKRTFKNDEEDIAALLANQLSSQDNPVTSDEFNVEEVLYSEKLDSLNNDYGSSFQTLKHKNDSDAKMIKAEKESESLKQENKVLYRGKLRKMYSCNVEKCTYTTILRKDLIRHGRIHTGERPYNCELCEKKFTRADKLLLHQRIHAGDKRYKCVECDYACVDSGSLIKHLRIHSGERPFKCQLCAYRARDSSQLTVHLRSHTGDSPFICTKDKCKAAFKTTSDLKRHMVIHSGEKPYACKYCEYRSTLKRNLHLHIQSQHPNGELKEYRCYVCPRYILPTIRKLKNHLRQCHQIEWNDVKNSKTGQNTESTEEAAHSTNSADQCITSLDKSDFETEDSKSINSNGKQYIKKKRRSKLNGDVVAVGVMNKAYSCKLCNMSFVCEESLHTHVRFHNKFKQLLHKRSEENTNLTENENQENLVNFSPGSDNYIRVNEQRKIMENCNEIFFVVK